MPITGTEVVKATEALSKPLVKLIKVVESGVGALGQPVLIILNAHAEGKARLVREGYDHQLRKLQAKHRAELSPTVPTSRLLLGPASELAPDEVQVIFDESSESEFVAARVVETEQQTKRRGNVATIAAEAADELPPTVSDDPVDPDWVARFFSAAQDISSEQAQKVWGKMLAGQVARPGSYSVRAVDVLRNMSTSEAQLFNRFVSYATDDGFVLNPDDVFHSVSGMGLRDVLHLEDAGLVARSIHWHAQAIGGRAFHASIVFTGASLNIIGPALSTSKSILNMPAYRLTTAGRELRPLLRLAHSDAEFITAIERWIRKRPGPMETAIVKTG